MTSVSFCVNEADKCVYHRFSGGEGVNMDDILLFGNNMDSINKTKSFLSQNFDMKDLGEVDVILNIKLIKSENEIILSQFHYMDKVLTRFGFMNCKSVATSYDPNVKLHKNTGYRKD